ncbi:hypothetical protein D3C86_1380050 [compost metagenome]
MLAVDDVMGRDLIAEGLDLVQDDGTEEVRLDLIAGEMRHRLGLEVLPKGLPLLVLGPDVLALE